MKKWNDEARVAATNWAENCDKLTGSLPRRYGAIGFCEGWETRNEEVVRLKSLLRKAEDINLKFIAHVVRRVCGLGDQPMTAREVDLLAENLRIAAIKANEDMKAISNNESKD